jgi:hypothetical protein
MKIGHPVVGRCVPSDFDASRTGEAGHAISRRVTKTQTIPVSGFTPGERDYIRRALDVSLPTVTEGP